jgi:hypothetical protein
MRTTDRKDNEDPKEAKSNTDKLDPSAVLPKTERLLPIRA